MRQGLIVAAVLLGSGAVARAAPSDDLDRARQLFRQRDYLSASKELDALLYPTLRLPERGSAVEAHILFGACELELGDPKTAHDEFDKALELDPERTLDALSFSPPAIKLLEDVKVERRVAAERAAERLKAAQDRAKFQQFLKNAVIYEEHPWYLSYVPFGVGQYQNDDRKKGVFFTVSEVLALGTSFGIWYYLVDTYGITGTVDPRLHDPHAVRLLQQVEIGSGAAFIGLALWGVIDARLHYQPTAKIDPSQLPASLRDLLPGAPRPKAPSSSLHLGPILVPSGAGIGLSWER